MVAVNFVFVSDDGPYQHVVLHTGTVPRRGEKVRGFKGDQNRVYHVQSVEWVVVHDQTLQPTAYLEQVSV